MSQRFVITKEPTNNNSWFTGMDVLNRGGTSGGDLEIAVFPEQPLVNNRVIQMDVALSGLVLESKRPLMAELVAASGCTWARERVEWVVAKHQDNFLPGVKELVHAGLSVLAVPVNQPQNLTPNEAFEWFHAMSKAHPEVLAWETFNEADSQFTLTDERFVPLQAAAYYGIRSGNPRALVVLGGLVNPPGPWLNKVVHKGVLNNCDVLGLHWYGYPQNLWPFLGAYKEVLGTYGKGHLPIWMTEMGADSKDQKAQITWFWQSFSLALVGGANQVFCFLLPYLSEAAHQYGLLDQELKPTPSLFSVSFLSSVLGNALPLGYIQYPEGSLGLVFQTGKELAMIGWGGGAMPDSVPEYRVAYDMRGQKVYPGTFYSEPFVMLGLPSLPTGMILVNN